ncbi:SDR family oxidoreductase [Candidatus Bathyarchaeota archaeon]|nr:SDR family oxidoreductase [Candidatus Bathyarchaeota archaeon]
MKVLITGGAGFIGSHLADALIDMGYEVRVFDNLSVGSRKDLEGLDAFIYGDVRDRDAVFEALRGVDAVVHLASLTSVEESVRKPLEYHEVNVTGTLNVLDACVKAGVEKFVFSSSASVYGEPSELPVREDSPTNPLSPYAASKLAAEHYVNVYHRVYGLNTVVFRLFNVYGCGQPLNEYSGVIARFLSRVRRGEPPIIYGDGLQTRDFIYIDDVVDAFILALNADVSAETFNIAYGKPTTINELANVMLKLSGMETLKPIYMEARKGDIVHSYADISKARKMLKFNPKVSLEEGLAKMLNTL